MKRSIPVVFRLALFGLSLFPVSLRADPPDIIGSYRFPPLVSTIAPIGNLDYPLNVYGTFDFTRGWDYRGHPPTIVRYADFENVNAWAQNPFSLAPALSVDAIFNLSGLDGELLPAASIFDVYKFDGKNAAGDQVELFVSVLGPWLYLRGHTEFAEHPEQGWQMNAFAHERPFADFDEDGDVDAGDLTAWKERAGAWTGRNDADGDNFQTGDDFLYWQQQVGQSPPNPSDYDAGINASIAAAATAIPEPATLALLAAVVAVLASSARRARLPMRSAGPGPTPQLPDAISLP
jgi:hypothetical protein